MPFDLRLRLYTNPTTKGRILPAQGLDFTPALNSSAILRFSVSERAAAYLPAGFVVAVEYRSTSGAWVEPRNGRFLVTGDDGDAADDAKLVGYTGVGLIPWLLGKNELAWSGSAKDGERAWTNRSPGFILNTFLVEGKNRGWAPFLTYGFTGSVSSSGTAWPADTLIDASHPLRTKARAVLDGLAGSGLCDWWTQGNELRLELYGAGLDRTSGPGAVLLGPGASRRQGRTDFSEVFTDLTVIPEKSRYWVYLNNPGAPTAFGRLEETLTLDGIESQTVATKLAQPTLQLGRSSRREYTVTYTATEKTLNPFEHYNIGDLVRVNTREGIQNLRVVEITAQRTLEGEVRVTVAFEYRFRSLASRLAGRSGASSAGRLVGGVSNRPIPSAPPLALPRPKAPTGLTVTGNVGDFDGNGSPRSLIDLGWTPVAQGIDDSTVDVTVYDLWLARDGAPFERVTSVSSPEAQLFVEPLVPMQAKVRAGTEAGLYSEFSTPVSFTGDIDTTPLPAPTPPVLSSSLGTVTIRWDGDLTVGALPTRFRYVSVEVSSTSGGTYAPVGQLLEAGDVLLTGAAVGSEVWARLIAFDSIGTPSAATAPLSITVDGVRTLDLDAEITDAILNAQETADAVALRGSDLVRNGDGVLGDSRNWPGNLTRNAADRPTGTYASFETALTTAQGSAFLDDLIPVNPAKKYLPSVFVRQVTPGVTGRFYLALSPHDADDLAIAPVHYMEQPGTRTTLAAPLNPGDTTIALTSSAGWNNAAGASSHLRNIIVWNYVDGAGKAWPVGEYSRNVKSNAYADGGINTSTHIITLSSPWTGPAAPAGTPISNGSSAGSFLYPVSQQIAPEVWTAFGTTLISGVHTNNAAGATTSFPVATASVKIGLLTNYSVSGGSSRMRFAGVSFSEVGAATIIANGKSRTVFSTLAATGTDYSTGDVWYQKTGDVITAVWEFLAGAWVPKTLGDSTINNLNAAKILAGTLDAARIGAQSLSTEKLLVANLTNLLEDPGFEKNSAVAWNNANASVTKSTTTPRSGTRCLRVATTTSAFEASRHQTAIAVQPGEQYLFSGWVRMEGAGSGSAGGLELSVAYGATAADTTTIAAVTATAAGLNSTYVRIAGSWTVPAGVYFVRPRIVSRDATAGKAYLVDDLAFSRRADGELIVDGAITALKIAADAVEANAIKADAVTSNKIAAGAIDGKIITGATVRTAASGARVQLDSTGLKGFDAGGVARTTLGTDGLLTATGATIAGLIRSAVSGQRVELDLDSLMFYAANGSSGSITVGDNGASGQIMAIVAGLGAILIGQQALPAGGSAQIQFDGVVEFLERAFHRESIRNSDDGLMTPWAIEAGRRQTTGTVAAGASVTLPVSFTAGRFTQPPIVTASPDSNSRLQVACGNVTTSGFDLILSNFTSAGATPVGAYWQAMQMTKTSATG